MRFQSEAKQPRQPFCRSTKNSSICRVSDTAVRRRCRRFHRPYCRSRNRARRSRRRVASCRATHAAQRGRQFALFARAHTPRADIKYRISIDRSQFLTVLTHLHALVPAPSPRADARASKAAVVILFIQFALFVTFRRTRLRARAQSSTELCVASRASRRALLALCQKFALYRNVLRARARARRTDSL